MYAVRPFVSCVVLVQEEKKKKKKHPSIPAASVSLRKRCSEMIFPLFSFHLVQAEVFEVCDAAL